MPKKAGKPDGVSPTFTFLLSFPRRPQRCYAKTKAKNQLHSLVDTELFHDLFNVIIVGYLLLLSGGVKVSP